ncbi:MAG: glycosyltransferase [Chloroflexota bacterium]
MFITIVVCTRDRPAQLRRCLATIQPQLDDSSELLLVASAPSTDQERQIAQAVGARFVYEPRPGLDVARNRGIQQANGEIVAFVDDDVRLADNWLPTLRQAFQDASVACVTGRVRPVALDTAVQQQFEARFSFDRGPEPIRFTGADARPWFPIHPYHLGTGGNMAFRRELFTQIGLFDEALDAGTPTGGGGDLDIFRRLLLAGFTAVYQPDLLVYHAHRSTEAAARQQFYAYGKAFSALMTKIWLQEPSLKWQVPQLVRQQLALLLRLAGQRLVGKSSIPLPLILREGAGNLAGPLAYRQARRQARPMPQPLDTPDSPQPTKEAPSVAVIICTRQRPDALRRCLHSLAPLRPQLDQLIVVENSAAAGETAVLAQQFAAQLIVEPEPGLCRARNRGLAAAHTEVVAYLDDDVELDETWLGRLTAVYQQNPHAAGVMGLVLPRTLETADQQLFESALGGLNRGLAPRRFAGRQARRLAPQVGVGANMSFRRHALRQIGGFDAALDPGTPAQAGGDIDIFYQLLNADQTLLYDPALRVWHTHRREAGAARQMSAAYGRGTAAAYAKWLAQGDLAAGRMLLGYWLRYHPARVWTAVSRSSLLSPELAWAGWRASWAGPWAYWQGRRAKRPLPEWGERHGR